jgi:hypothetical protein
MKGISAEYIGSEKEETRLKRIEKLIDLLTNKQAQKKPPHGGFSFLNLFSITKW